MTTQIPHAVSNLLHHFPAIAKEIIEAKKLPAKPVDYQPVTVEIYFDDVLAVKQINGVIQHELPVPANYVPDVITLYGDDELLLVQADRQILFNRLPQNFEQQDWISYGK
jgi:hypothetical protein